MSAKRFIPVATAVAAVIFFASVVVLAVVTTVSVYPGNLQGWQTETDPGSQPTPASTPSVAFVFGPDTPPLGRGSAQLKVGSDGDAAAQLRHPGYAGTALPNPSPSPDEIPAGNELTALSYSTYVQVPGSGGQAPYILLNIDNDNDGVADDFLFFEPVFQNGTYSKIFADDTIPNQCGGNPACVVTGQWQSWDAFVGGWWSANESAGGPPLITLSRYRQEHPNARIVNTSTGQGGLRLVAGFGAGSWDNFVGNVDKLTVGVGFDPDTGVNGTTYDFEPKAPPVQASRGVIISELRNSGPNSGACIGAPVSAGVVCVSGNDEYVELYNTTDNEISVTDEVQPGSTTGAGWALVRRGLTCADPPVVVATIPNGTTIPARGHYLLAGSGYSLAQYASGDGSSFAPKTTAVPDQIYSGTIAGDADVGLFNTTDSHSFDINHRLDAVGFNNGSGDTCDLLTEGTPLPNTRGSTQQYAFVRREPLTGGVQDTGNNRLDFVEVSTEPHTAVGDNPAPTLGTPGPQNTSSPVNKTDVISLAFTSPSAGQAAPPNRERNSTPDGSCSPLGTLLIRRSVTNNSGVPISRLRFRVIDVTTVNDEDESGGGAQAVLHVRSSSDEDLTAIPGRGNVHVYGLQDEQEFMEDETQCGGLNTSLTVSNDIINLDSPLAPGATIDVVFLLGVEQTGHFLFYVNVEALEASAPPETGKPSASAFTKRPTPVAGVTPPKPPATSTAPPATHAAAPAGTQGTTQTPAPPKRPTMTPGVRPPTRDTAPDTRSDPMPVSRRMRRDSL